MDRTVAALNYQGKVKTAIEIAGGAEQEIVFGAPSAANPSTHAERDVRAQAEGENFPEPSIALANATLLPDQAGNAATRAADATGAWVAGVRFGFPQRDGAPAPGTPSHDGRVMIAQCGPNTFLLTGVNVSARFHRPGYLAGIRMQILRAEQGYFTPGATPGAPEVWRMTRLLNGDEDDRGIRFPADPVKVGMTAVKITVGRF